MSISFVRSIPSAAQALTEAEQLKAQVNAKSAEVAKLRKAEPRHQRRSSRKCRAIGERIFDAG